MAEVWKKQNLILALVQETKNVLVQRKFYLSQRTDDAQRP